MMINHLGLVHNGELLKLKKKSIHFYQNWGILTQRKCPTIWQPEKYYPNNLIAIRQYGGWLLVFLLKSLIIVFEWSINDTCYTNTTIILTCWNSYVWFGRISWWSSNKVFFYRYLWIWIIICFYFVFFSSFFTIFSLNSFASSSESNSAYIAQCFKTLLSAVFSKKKKILSKVSHA